jgi:hypothetical protein
MHFFKQPQTEFGLRVVSIVCIYWRFLYGDLLVDILLIINFQKETILKMVLRKIELFEYV